MLDFTVGWDTDGTRLRVRRGKRELVKNILFAVAPVTGALILAGSTAAGIAVPKAYSVKDTLIAFTRGNLPRLTGISGRSRAPQVVVKGARLEAGPIHTKPIATSGLTGYVDQAATGVHFTYIKTHFKVPSVSGSYGCNHSVGGYGVLQTVAIDAGQPVTGTPDNEEAGISETGCNGVTTADFFYNLAGYGAFYYGGVNPGDAIEASIAVGNSGKYRFQVNDLSTDRSLQVTMGCQVSNCPNSTAEVFSQAGNLGGGVVPDFTRINFTGTAVRANFGKIRGNLAAKPGKWTSEAVREQDLSIVTPSPLRCGRTFSNTWVS